MFRKILLVSLVLFGLVSFSGEDKCFADAASELEQAKAYESDLNYGPAEVGYKSIVANYPGTDYALEAQKRLVMMYEHNQPLAQAAFQELVTDFSSHELVAETIYEIAEHYSETGPHNKYEIVKQLCQSILDNWSGSDYAIWAQSGVAISDISLGNMQAAQAAVEDLVDDFSGDEDAAKAVYDVAHQYNRSSKYEEAGQLYQYVIDNWPQDKIAMWQQVDSAHSNIADGNDTAAQTAIDVLVANISNYDFIAGALYDIAERYSRTEEYGKAEQIYQCIVDNQPNDYYAMWSQMYVAMSEISLDNETAAGTAINQLIADFSDNERISDAVFVIADHYDRLGRYEKARQYYQYVLEHWPDHEHHSIWTIIHLARMNIALGNKSTAEAVIDGLVANLDVNIPLYSYWPAVAGEIYCQAADCYCQVGEYAKAITCYEKIVSDYPEHRRTAHALFSVGHNYERLKESGMISKSQADAKTKAAYEQLLEKYPDFEACKTARHWLEHHNSK